jgi:D-serine deaminase-like pyridoxal phosphate-dependent protein
MVNGRRGTKSVQVMNQAGCRRDVYLSDLILDLDAAMNNINGSMARVELQTSARIHAKTRQLGPLPR